MSRSVRCRTWTNGGTDAALEQMANTADPRLKEIMDAAVRHLHAFVRDVEPDPGGVDTGIQFLTAVGQACTRSGRNSSCCPTCWASAPWSMRCTTARPRNSARRAACSARSSAKARRNCLWAHKSSSKPTVPENVIYGQVTDNDGTPSRPSCRSGRPASAGCTICRQERRELMDMRAQFPHRRNRPLSFPNGASAGLLHSDGWAGGRDGARAGTARLATVAYSYADRGDGHRELVTALYFGDDDHIDSDTVFGVSGSLVVAAKDDPDCRSRGCAPCATISGWPRRSRRKRTGWR